MSAAYKAWMRRDLLGALPFAVVAGYAAAGETCHTMPSSIHIIDGAEEKALTDFSHIESPSQPFNRFIAEVGSQFVRKCPGVLIDVTFVRTPFLDKTSPRAIKITSAHVSNCRIESPWADIIPGYSPSSLRAIFHWNERQLLLDQAILSGETLPSPVPLAPLYPAEFDNYVRDYTVSVLLAPSPEAREEAQKAVSARIPPDTLWLFRKAWQSTLAPFEMEAESALATALERLSSVYADLAVTLAGRCLADGSHHEVYANILKLAPTISTDHFRITSLH